MRESIEIIEGDAERQRNSSTKARCFAAQVPKLKSDAHMSRDSACRCISAATGPVLQRMAGSHSDGLLTASITTPAFVRYSRKMMEEGARKAGRIPPNWISAR